ncbi:unnamed protein product [Phytophthora lilii]|uniref:Unnamed protein product n=1 Tax=Phytophthora lilii TaxID=2077276 RepID=A0A9W6TCY0_9STRA|nr:unnamed protein product [Phytophthora lilii]
MRSVLGTFFAASSIVDTASSPWLLRGSFPSSPLGLTTCSPSTRKNPSKRTNLITVISKNYGEEKTSRILQAAKRDPDTAKTASKLEVAQIQFWVKNAKSPDDVFKSLGLAKAGDKLFENKQLATWLSYTEDFALKYGKETSPVTTLTAEYGDETLLELLNTAKKAPAMEDVATKLLTEQIQHWLRIKKFPDDVFKVYALSKAGDDLLTSSQLASWTSYLQAFNKGNPTACFGDIQELW